ncbi:hypothetical protein CPLU01_08561 [Colletotrichum plurivorum]|uniref:Uncharacterized protein n=1 Tax=Colletotrichum plurivorum TaxID=2175906 RepID=A0A8H6NCE1_9PEZI|nr:hypothetical protein CPLU01_08561 [Colletotrichum plurivorum]
MWLVPGPPFSKPSRRFLVDVVSLPPSTMLDEGERAILKRYVLSKPWNGGSAKPNQGRARQDRAGQGRLETNNNKQHEVALQMRSVTVHGHLRQGPGRPAYACAMMELRILSIICDMSEAGSQPDAARISEDAANTPPRHSSFSSSQPLVSKE